MADSVGSVALDIVMGKNTVTGVVTQAMADCQKVITDSSATVGQKVGAIGTASQQIGRAIMPVSAAVGGVGIASVKTAATFEESMSQVAATMGMTSEEINNGSEDYKKLETAARDMGSKTKYSASEAAEALNYLALAGYDVNKSVDTLPTVLNLACAGGIDLASASDMVTDAMSALGDTAGTTENFVDKMAKTSQKSNTSVAQLGEAILTVGGTAKNLAGGTTELNTCLGILADNGIKGAEGGTALRNMILSLSAPTDTAAAKMEELGLQVYDANGNMRPLNDIFNDLNGIMSTMTQGEQTDVLNTIFNKVDLKSANAMLANSGDRFNELSGYLENCDGAAATMADTMNNNLNGQLAQLKSALEEAGISIGQSLLPMIKEGTDFVQSLTDKFNSLDEGTQQLIIKIALGVAAAGPLLLVFGKVASGIGGVIGVFGKLSGAAKGVGSAAGTVGKLGDAAGKAGTSAGSAAGGVGKLSQNALGLVAAGAGILLASVGLALLAKAAIDIAQAGPAAGVAMAGLVVSLGIMAVGAAALAPALTAGAVGLVAFGAGLALVGVGVLAASAGIALFSGALPTIVTYGGQAASVILMLSGALLTFSGSALATAGSCTVLGAGLLAMGAGALVAGAGALVAGAGMLVLMAGTTAAGAAMLVASAGSKMLSASLPLVAAGALRCSAGMLPLSASTIAFGAAAVVAGAGSLLMSAGLLGASLSIAAFSAAALLSVAGIAAIKGGLVKCGDAAANLGTGLPAAAAAIGKLSAGSLAASGAASKLNTAFTAMSNACKQVDSAVAGTTAKLTAFTTGAKTTQVAVTAATAAFKLFTAGVNALGTATTAATNAVKSGMNGMRSGVQSGVNGAVAAANSGAANIRNAFTPLAAQAPTWGIHMMQGLASGINSQVGVLAASARRAAQSVSAQLHFTRPDEGPLRNYEEWMPHFVQGMSEGLNQSIPTLDKAVGNVADSLTLGLQAPKLQNVGAQPQGTTNDNAVLNLLSELVSKLDVKNSGGNISIPIYLDGRIIDEYMVNANNRKLLRSGGTA